MAQKKQHSLISLRYKYYGMGGTGEELNQASAAAKSKVCGNS